MSKPSIIADVLRAQKKITIPWGTFQMVVTTMGWQAKELKSGEIGLYGPRRVGKKWRGPIRFYPKWRRGK